MWRAVLLCCLALSLSLIAGCKSGPGPHNLTYVFNSFDGEPDTVVHADPEADLAASHTYALEVSADEGDALAARQLAWLAADQLDLAGYRRVETADQADLVVRMLVNNEYREQYIPPQEYTQKVWVPRKEVEVEVNTREYGTYYGNSRTKGTVAVPGHYETQMVKRPGRTDAAYYPSISIEMLDAGRLHDGTRSSEALIWEGRAIGRSSLGNIVLTGQCLLARLLNRFPLQREVGRLDPGRPTGRIGASIGSATADGANFYPMVASVVKRSPADRAGLRPYDLITAINGVSTANMPMADFLQRLAGEPGAPRTLVLQRLREVKTVPITLVSEADLTGGKR